MKLKANKFDQDILESDMMFREEFMLKPQFYIHYSNVFSSQALLRDDFEDAITRHRLLVDDMEHVAIAAGLIQKQEYDKEIKELVDQGKISDMSQTMQRYKKSCIRKQVILKNCFDTSPIRTPAKLDLRPEKKKQEQ